MNPVTGLNVLKAAAAAAMRDPDALGNEDAGLLRQYVAHALPECWIYAPWADLMTVSQATVTAGRVTKAATWGQVNGVWSGDFRSDETAVPLGTHDNGDTLELLAPRSASQTSVWVETWDPEPDLLAMGDTAFSEYEFPGQIATALALLAGGHLLRADGKGDAGNELLAMAQSNLATRARPVLQARARGVDRQMTVNRS